MTINFSAQEYFEELLLMEKQYGQEEALYPWIYMILQMAECKKLKRDKDLYQKVTIRDVHSAKRATFDALEKNKVATGEDKKAWTIRWELTKRVGPPDIAIMDTEDKILGCVEIKAFIDGDLFYERIIKKEAIYKERYQYVLEYRCKNKKELYEMDEKYIKEILRKNINVTVKETIESFIITSKSKDDLETQTKRILTNGSKKLLAKCDWQSKYNIADLPGCEKPGQIAGHLDKFKKLIYTNGLIFCYIKVLKDTDNNKEIIDVEEIINFTDDYYDYVNFMGSSVDFKNEWKRWPAIQKRWEDFIDDLSKIDWYGEPKKILNISV